MTYAEAINEIIKRKWSLAIFSADVEGIPTIVVQLHNGKEPPDKYGMQRKIDPRKLNGFCGDLVEQAVDECVSRLLMNPYA